VSFIYIVIKDNISFCDILGSFLDSKREREREALVGEKLGSDATTMMNEHELSLVWLVEGVGIEGMGTWRSWSWLTLERQYRNSGGTVGKKHSGKMDLGE
jgi:hypothetical protein